jgi:hypothetical protein
MSKTIKKLILNQETLQKLTANELSGEFCPSNCGCSNGTACLSCVECNPQDTSLCVL